MNALETFKIITDHDELKKIVCTVQVPEGNSSVF